MAKKTMVKDYDQFQLRLPPGLRERIKEKATRADMSMNEAIVWVLEREFPPVQSLENKLEELAALAAILRDSGEHLGDDRQNRWINRLIEEVESTLEEIVDKRIDAPAKFRKAVRIRMDEWNEQKLHEMSDRHGSPFDDAHHSEIEEPPESDPFKDAQQENRLKG